MHDHYPVRDNCLLVLERPHIFLTLLHKDQSCKIFRKVPQKATVRELKGIIVKLFGKRTDHGVPLFVAKDNTKYVKVGPKNVTVGEILSDDQILWYLEDKIEFNKSWPVICRKAEVGKVYCDKGDNVGTVKLRLQDQFGILVSRIMVKRYFDEKVADECKVIKNCTTHVRTLYGSL